MIPILNDLNQIVVNGELAMLTMKSRLINSGDGGALLEYTILNDLFVALPHFSAPFMTIPSTPSRL